MPWLKTGSVNHGNRRGDGLLLNPEQRRSPESYRLVQVPDGVHHGLVDCHHADDAGDARFFRTYSGNLFLPAAII